MTTANAGCGCTARDRAPATSIAGRGVFRRFKDRLPERPYLMTGWQTFAHERQRGRAYRGAAAERYMPVRRSD
jgi:hypothetical protein